MALSYKPLWHLLVEKKMNKEDLKRAANITSNIVSRMSMDLHNNAVGRGINVSGKSTSSIVDAVKSKVRNGSCKRIINDRLVATDGSGM